MKSLRFTPSLLMTVLSLVAVLGFLRLGFWQLERSEEKKLWEQRLQERPTLPVLNRQDLSNTPSDELAFRRVKLTGEFKAEKSFALEHQFYQHQPGYRMFSFFETKAKGDNFTFLVDHGFVNKLYVAEAFLKLSKKKAWSVQGIMLPFSNKYFILGPLFRQQNGTLYLQALDKNGIEHHFGQSLYPFYLALTETEEITVPIFQPMWNLPPALQARRHQAYAIQWFLFALITFLLYIALNLKFDKKRESDDI